MFEPNSPFSTYNQDRTAYWKGAKVPIYRRIILRRGLIVRVLVCLTIFGLLCHRYSPVGRAELTFKQFSHPHRVSHHGPALRPYQRGRDGVIIRGVSRSIVEQNRENIFAVPASGQIPVAQTSEVSMGTISQTADENKSPISKVESPEPLQFNREKSDMIVTQHERPAVKEDTAKEAEFLTPKSKNPGEPTRFPPYSDFVDLEDRAEPLPDIIHHLFEDSTADVKLEGWEDLWFGHAELDTAKFGNMTEPKIDFVYTWVNGSETAFQDTILPYEINSTLNDPEGKWLESHRVNRYRDWDELRFSIRTVEQHAGSFRNKYQLLVNAIGDSSEAVNATVDNPVEIVGKQRPLWMKNDEATNNVVEILSQEDFFDEREQGCLPTFNSLTIENQIFNTKSNTDRLFALSDDMLLGKPHAASDIYSPLFGPTMGFKQNSYNQINPPNDVDARRFGEKPFLIYTSWLLNRRFGERKRKGQIHFGHSLGRSVYREAQMSFPRPRLQSACQRFRGETGFQLYSWFLAFHYTMERHREALLWSYLMIRADKNEDGNLDWEERQAVMDDIEEGMSKEGQPLQRKRMFFAIQDSLEAVGLEAPKVNTDASWTSLDGPYTIQNLECPEFNVNECLAPGFSSSIADKHHNNHVFSTSNIFDYAARQHPKCGDCIIKLLLNRAEKGLDPMLPLPDKQPEKREVAIKALWKYQYTIVEPDAYFCMVTDAEQVDNVLYKRLIKKKGKVGQLCLNDDVASEAPEDIAAVRKSMTRLLHGLAPEPTDFENDAEAVAVEAAKPKALKSSKSKSATQTDSATSVSASTSVPTILEQNMVVQKE